MGTDDKKLNLKMWKTTRPFKYRDGGKVVYVPKGSWVRVKRRVRVSPSF